MVELHRLFSTYNFYVILLEPALKGNLFKASQF